MAQPGDEAGSSAKATSLAKECPVPVAPSGELAPWAEPAALSSAKDVSQLSSARLHVGQAARLALHPVEGVRFPAAPGKSGGHGGLAEVTIEQAGTYHVALSTPAWVDLVADGEALASIAHGHGPKCSSIHKVVDFTLQPGSYTLAISANKGDQAQVLVAKLPD